MNFTDSKITEIYFLVDEFAKEFEKEICKHVIGNPAKRPPTMSTSEVMTIMILFHDKGYKCMKHFYIQYVQKHLTQMFPKTVSYNRFTELMQSVNLPLALFLQTCCMGENTGISFMDSTPIRVCKNKRMSRNKVFKDLAQIGKSTMGFFYGFKLHLVINEKGELLNFVITPGNVDDREPLKDKRFVAKLKGKLFADKGYINSKLAELLFVDGIQLITSIKKNMKNCLMQLSDKILLRKRSVIETVNDELKNICQVEHSRHRSFGNFISNLIAGLVTYSFFSKKPSIKYETEKTNQLACFY
jgi:hypothetical protein